MMGNLKIEHCPETGICSIIKEDGKKVDLMPFEVDSLKEARSNPDGMRTLIAEANKDFADHLSEEELKEIQADLS